jgi:hypothetical protein
MRDAHFLRQAVIKTPKQLLEMENMEEFIQRHSFEYEFIHVDNDNLCFTFD